jgi:hypothetical protein
MGIITNAREAFDALTAQDGNQATWLTAMAAHFGKPHAITLRLGPARFTKGQFTPAHDWPDFQKRLAATLQRLRNNND